MIYSFHLLFSSKYQFLFSFDIKNKKTVFIYLTDRIKELLRLIEPYKPIPLDKIPSETTELCGKFELKYKSKCMKAIERDQR